MLIIRLVEKHVLAITTFSSPLLKNTLLIYAVLGTQALPVHGTHLKADAGSDEPYITVGVHRAHFGCHIDQAGLSLFLEAFSGRVEAVLSHPSRRVNRKYR
jgi:hypothetical protein